MGSNPSQELLRLLEIFHDIELAHARLYSLLGESHQADPSIAQLWRKTAREEESHAAQFKLAMSGAGGVVLAKVTLGDALHLLNAVEALVVQWKAHPPSVAVALQTSIEMEEALSRVHLHHVAVFEREAHRRLFSAMMATDQHHVGSLREALLRYSNSAEPVGGGAAGEGAAGTTKPDSGR